VGASPPDRCLTLDVCSQLLDRQKRDHGVAFDALLADAHSTLYGSQNEGLFSPPFRPPSPDTLDPASEPPEQAGSFAGTSGTRPARFELATSRSGGALASRPEASEFGMNRGIAPVYAALPLDTDSRRLAGDYEG
jgi:hypothetical protein